MTSDGTRTGASPLRHYLRSYVDAIAASFEAAAGSPGGSPKRRALERFLRALDELGAASDSLGRSDLPEQPRSPLVLVSAELAEEIGGAGCEVAVLQGAPGTSSLTSALEKHPALVVAAGEAAVTWISRLRELQPGLPAILVADDELASRARETFASDHRVRCRSVRNRQVRLGSHRRRLRPLPLPSRDGGMGAPPRIGALRDGARWRARGSPAPRG